MQQADRSLKRHVSGALAWLSNETPAADGSGGQRRQFHQIKALVQSGIDVHVVALDSAQDDASIRTVAPTSRYRPTSRHRWQRSYQSPELEAALSERSYAAAVVAHVESLPFVRPALEGASLRYAIDFQNVNSRWFELLGERRTTRRWRRIEHQALTEADMATCCSSQERDALRTHSPDANIAVAANGVDPTEWPDSALRSVTEPSVVIFASWSHMPNRLGLEWFLEAVWPHVRAARPLSRLVLAGPGELPSLAESRPGVEAVGRVDDLAGLLGAARLIAVPIVRGMGARMKFGEALASGTAVVSTSIGAEGADAANRFVRADEAASFTRACIELLDDEAHARRLGLAARDWALDELAWSRTVAPIRDFYASCVRTGTSG